MELIPVLDLMGGAVVRAQRGDRANYRPIVTPLCAGSDPVAVTDALLHLGRFQTLYIADLDAIAGVGDHEGAVAALRARYPHLDLWVDAGEADEAGLDRRRANGLGRPVVGSESVSDPTASISALRNHHALLSLDFGPEGPRGPRELHEEAAFWPDGLIVMSLARIGAGEGPDYDRLAGVMARAGGRRVYAAGGVRGPADLDRLAAMGLAGVLVSTALHDGRLSPQDIARFIG
ncbi:HisA/HisF-related TIM barrel protein [Ancylobacter sp. G4_0304]|uniref:HisA/HisF-related TIM barrel protein n=1 Tax=Ancylobacter sp. G4_0304 TaxID=3114289 RepID=UPI0039C73E54